MNVKNWAHKESQRIFFEKIAKDFGIKKPNEWGKVSTRQVLALGGGTILKNIYKGSLVRALKSCYPEINWKIEWFKQRAKSDSSEENQRTFLNKFSIQFGIKKPSDWGKITVLQFAKSGGKFILRKHKSIFNSLKYLFPENNWDSAWFQKKTSFEYWKDVKYQRKFLENIAKKYKVTSPKDWALISRKDLVSEGALPLLQKYGSLHKCLRKVFPDISWKEEWFITYWRNTENRRKFIETFAFNNGIKEPKDWQNVTNTQFAKAGGKNLLELYRYSIYNILEANFPEIQWKRDWFEKNKVQTGYWVFPENRRRFLDETAHELKINSPKDWGKISVHQLIKIKGGSGVLYHHGNCLFRALKELYPETKWERKWFANLKKLPKFYFVDKNNQKKFLDEIALTYNITNPNDWLRITPNMIKLKGGQTLLSQYNNSLYATLKAVYSTEDWNVPNNRDNTPRNFDHGKVLNKISKLLHS